MEALVRYEPTDAHGQPLEGQAGEAAAEADGAPTYVVQLPRSGRSIECGADETVLLCSSKPLGNLSIEA